VINGHQGPYILIYIHTSGLSMHIEGLPRCLYDHRKNPIK